MSVANSYARALFQVAYEKSNSKGVSHIEEELQTVALLLEQNRELQVALMSPLTTLQEKTGLLEELGKKLGLSPVFNQFLILLVRKGRLDLLRAIQENFNSVHLSEEGGVSGRLVSAEPVGDSDLNTLVKAFSQKLGKKVAFQVSTDPSLLAGIKVTVNGVTYDGTLRSQLQKLRDRFVTGFSGGNA